MTESNAIVKYLNLLKQTTFAAKGVTLKLHTYSLSRPKRQFVHSLLAWYEYKQIG